MAIYAKSYSEAKKKGVQWWVDRNGQWHDTTTGYFSSGPSHYKDKNGIWRQAGRISRPPKIKKPPVYAKSYSEAKKKGAQWWVDRNGQWHDTTTGYFSSGPSHYKDENGIWRQGGRISRPPKAKKPPTIGHGKRPQKEVTNTVRDEMEKIFHHVQSEVGGLPMIAVNSDGSVDGEIRIKAASGNVEDLLETLQDLYWSLPYTFISGMLYGDSVRPNVKQSDWDIVALGGQFFESVRVNWFHNRKTVRPHFFLQLILLLDTVTNQLKRNGVGLKVIGISIKLHYNTEYKRPHGR